ncbi:MAG: YtxH domain-containing protein [Chloroherpetonaceae bacterium]|nr:YtxH domain-containing protein [Chloroherpetonaceae bacterium]MCS7210309.1 YtxH domain-containing protein [Chloroherpetonaceae bacterium]MDW8019444.1 YtxH domain-containing protein [Chloroherpetonaceae bacterium]MDW8466024.1 YtxH domain-containing protein [Chloroherpetonaceae bacterium]
MQKDNYYKGLFVGTLLGAAIGTVLGMLFAPRRGEEMRRVLFRRLDESLQEGSIVSVRPALEMPVPNAIPPKEGAEPPDIENEAKQRAEQIVQAARYEADRLLREANSILREAKSLRNSNPN